MEQKLKKLQEELIRLKTRNDTTGDSALAYRELYSLGEFPRDSYGHYYVWNFYFQPLINESECVLMPVVTECWGIYTWSGGTDFYPGLGRCYASIDKDNPLHIQVELEYLADDSGWQLMGENVLSVTGNVPFLLKSSTKESRYWSL